MALRDFLRRSAKPAAAPITHAAHPNDPPPVSNDANRLAREDAREVVRQLNLHEKVDLDFTPMSLAIVEQILDRCSARGMRSPTHYGLVAGLGCYFGEVVRLNSNAKWVYHKDTPLASVPLYPPNFLHLALPSPEGEQYVNVFNKIIARLDGDKGTSLGAYYKAVISGAALRASGGKPGQA